MTIDDRTWVTRLRPAADGPKVRAAAREELLELAAPVLGESAVAWAAQQAAVLTFANLPPHSPFATPDDLPASERLGLETGLVAILLDLVEGRPPSSRETIPEALQLARRAARRGVPAEDLIAGAWRTHHATQQALLDAMGRSLGTLQSESAHAALAEMQRVGHLLQEFAERFTADLATAHREELRRWNADNNERSRARLLRLLETGAVAADDEQALGAALTSHHLIAIATPDVASTAPDPADLAPFCSAVGEQIGGHLLLSSPQGERMILWWVSRRAVDRESVVGVAALDAAPSSWRLAVGTAAAGVEGLRRSHERAVAVADLPRGPAGWPSVRTYADSGLLALLLADRERATSFCEYELEGLLDTSPRTTELRETVRVYLRHGGSRREAARILQIAPNTVGYRVASFEQRRGRPLQSRQRETLAALDIMALLADLDSMKD